MPSPKPRSREEEIIHELRKRIEKQEKKHQEEVSGLRRDLAQSEKDLRYCEDDLYDREDELADSKREVAELKRQLVGRRGQQAVGENERPAPQREGGESGGKRQRQQSTDESGNKRQRQQSADEVPTRAGAAAGEEEGARKEGPAGQGSTASAKGKEREQGVSRGLPSTIAAPASTWSKADRAIMQEVVKKDIAAYQARLIYGTLIGWEWLDALEQWVKLKTGTSEPRPLSRSGQEALCRAAGLDLKNVESRLKHVYEGNRCSDVRLHDARNEWAHTVSAINLARWLLLHRQGVLTILSLKTVELFESLFKLVFGVPHDASEKALRAAGSRSDAKRAYDNRKKFFKEQEQNRPCPSNTAFDFNGPK